MEAPPTFFGLGGSFLLAQASPQACHSLSRHIESPARLSMHIHPLVPARSSFILPSAPMPMTAAPRPMSGGAALVAFAMTAVSDCVPPGLAMPSWPDLGGSFGLSCATAGTAASTSTAASDTTILRMVTSSCIEILAALISRARPSARNQAVACVGGAGGGRAAGESDRSRAAGQPVYRPRGLPQRLDRPDRASRRGGGAGGPPRTRLASGRG